MGNIFGLKFFRLYSVCAVYSSLSCFYLIRYSDDGNPGDILINQVSIQNTDSTTYYETLGWNQGGLAGGYTGIEVFIFTSY